MISYELLPYDYSYALFLSYEYDLWHCDPMILSAKKKGHCFKLKKFMEESLVSWALASR